MVGDAPLIADSYHHNSTSHFATQMYCAGAEQQRCPDGTAAGSCMWFTNAMRPVTARDMNRTDWDRVSRRLSSDRWDPVRAHVQGFHYFDKAAAAACLAGKRIHVAGDSTTRDTFYELLAVGGHPIFTGGGGVWNSKQYEPSSPTTSGGKDVRGMCLGDFNKKWSCVRNERWTPQGQGAESEISFQFTMRSNSSWEYGQLGRNFRERPLDVALVQCPIYEWFRPDAYNYSLTKEERARVENNKVGPRHFEGIGASCEDYVQRVVRPTLAHDGRIFLIGLTPLPGWTRPVGGKDVEKKIFASINHAFGLRCHKHADGGWTLLSRHGIGAIDRYATVGIRRRDMIHPFFNAQFAIVQLALNQLCPRPQDFGRGATAGWPMPGVHVRP